LDGNNEGANVGAFDGGHAVVVGRAPCCIDLATEGSQSMHVRSGQLENALLPNK